MCEARRINEPEYNVSLYTHINCLLAGALPQTLALPRAPTELHATPSAVGGAVNTVGDCWASLELDVAQKYGEASLQALRKWRDADVVSLKARLGELQLSEAQMESVLGEALANV